MVHFLRSVIRILMISVSSLAFFSKGFALEPEQEPTDPYARAPGDIGAINLVYMFSGDGSLDTPPDQPNIDFVRFHAATGGELIAEQEGEDSGMGTLPDPFLRVVEEHGEPGSPEHIYFEGVTVSVPSEWDGAIPVHGGSAVGIQLESKHGDRVLIRPKQENSDRSNWYRLRSDLWPILDKFSFGTMTEEEKVGERRADATGIMFADGTRFWQVYFWTAPLRQYPGFIVELYTPSPTPDVYQQFRQMLESIQFD